MNQSAMGHEVYENLRNVLAGDPEAAAWGTWPVVWSPAGTTITSRSLGPAQPLGALPALAFPQVSPRLHHPTPGPSPCVPSDDGNGLNGNLRPAPATAALTTGTANGDLVVGLRASLPLTTGISPDGGPEILFWSSSPLLLHRSGTLLAGPGAPSPRDTRAVR